MAVVLGVAGGDVSGMGVDDPDLVTVRLLGPHTGLVVEAADISPKRPRLTTPKADADCCSSEIAVPSHLAHDSGPRPVVSAAP